MTPSMRRWAALVLLFFVLVIGAGVLFFGGWLRGPWFQGRPIAYWFPTRGGVDGDWEDTRLPRLVAGGPEVLPLLLAASQEVESLEAMRLEASIDRLPEQVRSLVPARVTAERRRDAARQVLSEWLPKSVENLRAYTNAIDRVPVEIQRDFTFMLVRGPYPWEIVEPHLLRVIERNAFPSGTAAACAALLQGRDPDPARHLPLVMQTMFALPREAWTERENFAFRQWVRGLARYTGQLGDAVPALAEWLTNGVRAQRASATLLLPFVDPERYPVSSTLLQSIPYLGQAGVSELVFGLREFRGEAQAPTTRRFVEELSPIVLDARALETWHSRWMTSSIPEVSGYARQGSVVTPAHFLGLFRELGPDARAAAGHAFPWLGFPDGEVALRAAALLGRIGPHAPETIPALALSLTNAVAVAPLTLLLAAYGPAAHDAVPALERVAADAVRFSGPPYLDGFSKVVSDTYGFPNPIEMRKRRTRAWVASEVTFSSNLVTALDLPGTLWPQTEGAATNRFTLADLARHALRRITAPTNAPMSSASPPPPK